ncbi:MAG: hypothetical protein PWQ97_1182 [Tepidanaerobacteraceae bacterium]|nr:hypothetical protein [Tepidanaerobacteraceae bacterium]
MRCEFCEEKIMEYLDGELDLQKKEHILRHINSCSRCSHFLTAMRAEYMMLSELPLLSPSPGFTRKVMSSIRNKRAAHAPGESVLMAAVLAFSALALHILALWNAEYLIFTLTSAARWFAGITAFIGAVFGAALWLMNFTAKLFTFSQDILVFNQRVLLDILGEYPVGIAVIALLSLVEVFLWGRLLQTKKS